MLQQTNPLDNRRPKICNTPPLGCVLNGYYRERYADRVIEPLYATSAAYSDGETTGVTISLDISEILQKDTDDIRARVAAHTGLPFEAVFVACIHTHTAPVISEIPGFFRRDEAYYAQFCAKICESAAPALADMREACAYSARAEAKGISFVRRFRMKDGTTATNPPWEQLGEIDSPIGTPDETVQLVKLCRDGAPDIAIVNFGTHPDVLGGTGICPDWPCYLRDTLEAALAKENDGMGVRVIFFNGAQGDVAHVDRMGGMQRRGVEHSRHMGRTIAGVVLPVYTYAGPIESERVFCRQRMAQAALNKRTAEQVTAAHAFNARYLAGEDIPVFRFNDIVLARRYIRFEHCPRSSI